MCRKSLTVCHSMPSMFNGNISQLSKDHFLNLYHNYNDTENMGNC